MKDCHYGTNGHTRTLSYTSTSPRVPPSRVKAISYVAHQTWIEERKMLRYFSLRKVHLGMRRLKLFQSLAHGQRPIFSATGDSRDFTSIFFNSPDVGLPICFTLNKHKRVLTREWVHLLLVVELVKSSDFSIAIQ
jgi:hypothetical protein